MVYKYKINNVEKESVNIELNKANSETTDLGAYVYSLMSRKEYEPEELNNIH